MAVFIVYFYKSLNTLGFQAIEIYEQDRKNDEERRTNVKQGTRVVRYRDAEGQANYCDE